jgi:integrase
MSGKQRMRAWGVITRRGENSWRLKFDLGRDGDGRRRTRYVTVYGSEEDAEHARHLWQREVKAAAKERREVADPLPEAMRRKPKVAGPAPLSDLESRTVAEHVRAWLDGADVSPKTKERYRQLVEQQLVPHLGAIPLRKLHLADVKGWHATLAQRGGADERPLSKQTVWHAHRVLHRALTYAVELDLLPRNVAGGKPGRPPMVRRREAASLTPEQHAELMHKLAGHPFYPIALLALASGARRGELLALRWSDVDLDGASLRIARSLEETGAGLRFKEPKTQHGRRSMPLAPQAVEALRAHRRGQLELRMALGLGRPAPDALVFATPEGEPMSPDKLSRDWRRLMDSLGLPPIGFHALRHTHVSMLISAGVDVLSVSRLLGHGSPAITLNVYSHLFTNKDAAAAAAIEAALRTAAEH